MLKPFLLSFVKVFTGYSDMRRFLAIVILSYITVYYYLDFTYWSNTGPNLHYNAVNSSNQKELKQQSLKNHSEDFLISQRSDRTTLPGK